MRNWLSGKWYCSLVLVTALAPAIFGLSASSSAQDAKEPPPPKYTEVSFVSGPEKTKIKVGQYAPEGKGPFPGIVLLHGIDGLDLLKTNLQVQFLYGTVANQIARKGFVVHFVHYFHRTPLTKEELPKVKEDLQKQILKEDGKLDPKLVQYYHDWLDTTKDSVDFLRDQKSVDKNRIGVVGLSLGGFVGTSLIVKYPDLKINIVANLFGGLPKEHVAEIREKKMKLPPILIMGGEEDDVVPERFQREVFLLWRERGASADAHFYSGFGHAFFDKSTKNYDQNMALNEALPTTIRFLKQYLQPTADKNGKSNAAGKMPI